MPATLQAMLSMGLEIMLLALLAATLVYCVLLERRLSSVRRGQEGLKRMIGELNGAIAGAGASIRALKSAAGEAADTLDDRLRRARTLSDELSLITNSGERLAQRFDRAVAPAARSTGTTGSPLPSGSVMNRLKAVR